jgi:hypothetical protein
MPFDQVSFVVNAFVVLPTCFFCVSGVALNVARISKDFEQGSEHLNNAAIVGHIFALISWAMLLGACVLYDWDLCRFVYVAIGGS